MFTELEQRINAYIDSHRNTGGKEIIQRFHKCSKVKGTSTTYYDEKQQQ